MRTLVPVTRSRLYWVARLTLVNRAEDITAFDAVFEAVFADAVLPVDPVSLRAQRGAVAAAVPASDHRDEAGPHSAGPAVDDAPTVDPRGEYGRGCHRHPDTLPSRIVARAEEPFEQFDEADLRLIGTWLEQSAAHWPTRRSMRAEPHHAGKHIDLRATLRRSRTTGWEPVELAGPGPAVRAAGWCWCVTSAARCSRMRRSTYT